MAERNESAIDDPTGGIDRAKGRKLPTSFSADRMEERIDAENSTLRPTADRIEQQSLAFDDRFYGRLGRDIKRYLARGSNDRSETPVYRKFDFSSSQAYPRAFNDVALDSSNEYYDRLYRYEPSANAVPSDFSTPRSRAAQTRIRRQNALSLLATSVPDVLDSFPTLRGPIAAVPDLNEDDVRNLVNLHEMETAWQLVLETGDEGAAQIFASMNIVQRAGFTDYVEQRLQSLFEEAQKDPSWLNQGFEYFMKYGLGPMLDGLFFLSETTQQGLRANFYAIENDPANAATALAAGPVAPLVNAFRYWDSVASGTYDEDKLQELRTQHGGVVDVFLDLNVKSSDGLGNAEGRWMDEWAGTEYEYVLDEVINRVNENPDLTNLARSVAMTRTDQIGQMFIDLLPQQFSQTEAADLAAGAINFGYTVGADPTIFASKAYTVARASRYALTKLGVAGGADIAFKYNRTRRLFDALGKDLGRVQEIKDPGKRALARLKIDEQYSSQLPTDVIDDLANFNGGIRSAADAYDYFRASENFMNIAAGAPTPRFTQSELFARLNAAQKGRRTRLIPGKSVGGVIASNVRRTTAFMNPATKGDVSKSSSFLPADPGDLATVLAGEEYGAAVGMAPRITSSLLEGSKIFGYKYSLRGVSARLDRLFRNWAKAPFNMTVDISSAKDATKIYEWSRAFLPRYHASIIADAFRNGNQGTRKLIIDGLQNSSSRARGVQFRSPDSDLLRFSSESKRGRRYSPKIEIINDASGAPKTIERVVDAKSIADFGATRQKINFATVENRSDDIGDDVVDVYGKSFDAPDGWFEQTFPGVDDVTASGVVQQWARDNGYSVVRYNNKTVALPEMAAWGANDPAINFQQALKTAQFQGKTSDEAYVIATRGEQVPDIVLEQTVQSRSMSSFPNPNNPDEFIEMPLHPWQASNEIAMPNFNEIYEAGVNASVFGASLGWTHGAVAQKIVDAWSLFNLAGPRYFLRNATEDYIMYAMTSGNIASLQRGRRMSAALRETRGGKRRGLNRIRSRSRTVDLDSATAARWSAIKASFSEEDIAKAQVAAAKGDLSEIRRIAAIAMGRMKFSGMDGVETQYFLDYITLHGQKMIDEIAGTTRFGSSAAQPGYINNSALRTVVDEKGNKRAVKEISQYTDISPSTEDPLSFMYWHKNLVGAADNDGIIGKIAIANLDKADDEIVPLIVRALEADEVSKTGFGYKERLASLNLPNVTKDQWARRYISDVRNLFSKKDGTLNRELWEKVATVDPKTGERVVRMANRGSKETSFAIEVSDLMDVPVGIRPSNVLGEASEEVPVYTPGEMLKQKGINFFNLEKWWEVMGDQYAVFAREPIFFANYIEARKALAPLERAWTEQFGEELAMKKLASIATDRAYLDTLAYTDNPLDRTLLAWNARNVARYYRATEDFARRMLRVGKNYPVGFWKVALVYDTLEETGFVWSDSNDDKFFVFPGSDIALSAISGVLDILPGDIKIMQFDNANFEMRGMVRMIAPGTDPNQAIPSLSSPIVALPVKGLISMFPALESFEQALLGEYSEGREWWQAMIPGHIMRALNLVSRDERNSMYASTIKDAIVMAAAANKVPPPDASDAVKRKFQGELQVFATTVLITRLLGGVTLNTTPRPGFNDVTDFARDAGFVDMDDALKSLIDAKSASGAFNPVGEAMEEYVSIFGLDAAAYTSSKYETGNFSGSYSGTSMPATEEARIWAIENNDLITDDKYRAGATWLMPRTGEFSNDMWRYSINLGARQPKATDDFYNDLSGIQGAWLLRTTREENDDRVAVAEQERYQAVLAGDQNKIAEMDELIKRYNYDFEEIAKPKIIAAYPYLENQSFEIEQNSRALTIRNEIRPTLNYVINNRDEEPPVTAIKMQEALDTFDDYIFEIDTITGRTKDDVFRKKALRAELKSLLNDIASDDDNTKLFVDTMLIPMVDRPEGYVSIVSGRGIVENTQRILMAGGLA